MKYLIAFLLSIAAASAAELEAHAGDTMVGLNRSKCVDEKVLSFIRPEFRSQFRDGVGRFEGREVALCWAHTSDGALIVDEDGETVVLPLGLFGTPL